MDLKQLRDSLIFREILHASKSGKKQLNYLILNLESVFKTDICLYINFCHLNKITDLVLLEHLKMIGHVLSFTLTFYKTLKLAQQQCLKNEWI